MATLEDAIKVYRNNRMPNFLDGLNNVLKLYLQKRESFRSDILLTSIVFGEHQERLLHHKYIDPIKMKKDAISALRSLLPIPRPNDFETLYDKVEESLKKVDGIKNLTYYDIALRIGFLYEEPLLPREKVYLAAGALEGIEELSNSADNGGLFQVKEWKEGRYDISEFTGAFGDMESMYIEDFLCVFHDELENLSLCSIRDLQKGIRYKIYAKNAPQYYHEAHEQAPDSQF